MHTYCRVIALNLFLLIALQIVAQLPNYIPTDSLIAYYDFNAGQNATNDISGNGNNGSVFQLVNYTADRFGTADHALQGGSGAVQVPAAAIDFGYNQDFTVSVWHTRVLNGLGHLLSTSMNSSTNFLIKGEATGLFTFQFGSIQNNLQTQILDNNWHHSVYVYENGSAILYLDGQPICSTSINQTEALQIGQSFSLGAAILAGQLQNEFNGKYDDVGIWRRALTHCEVLSLFNAVANYTQASAGPDIITCAGDEIVLEAQNAISAFWSDGVINGLPFVPLQNNYVLTAIDVNNCISYDTVFINTIQPVNVSQNISSCTPYLFNGQLITASGTYTSTFNSWLGCDSIVTIEFQLFTAPQLASLSVIGSFIQATQMPSYFYQWYNCNTGQAVAGANDYLFQVLDSAWYQVVTINSCGSDTSECVSLYPDAALAPIKNSSFSVNPNPNNGDFSIYIPTNFVGESIRFLSIDGITLLTFESESTNQFFDLRHFSSGWYWVQIGSNKPIPFIKN